MNRCYRLIWNEATRAWVPVSEIARARGKSGGLLSMVALVSTLASTLVPSLAASPAFALGTGALPSGGTVSSGSATIGQSGTTMTINQQSQNVAINWPDFNVGSKATLNFVQPNSSAIAVNRVYGTNGTQILGNLNANGQVWVINPNGVLFGSSAQVNVGGLVASTLGLSDADFEAGKRTFSGSGGKVTNQGNINAGYVALLGEQVRNEGVIVARLGTVALGAGNKVTLDFAGDRLINMQVDNGALKALVENKNLIEADGGAVLMTAKAKDALIDTVVNNTGIIRARTLENREGRIMLIGDMDSGTTTVNGTLDAGAANGGKGGFIETSAAHVKIANTAKVTTKAAGGKSGSWLIDPVDFTIAASGGDMTGAALSNALANNNVTIESTRGRTGTAGDVNVKDTVSWSANTLTLNAQNNINILAQMNGSGTAGLALEYGQGAVATNNTSTYNINAPVNLASTGSFSTKLGSDGAVTNYTIITSLGAEGSTTGKDLQGMEGNWSGNYVLGADIDASATAGWNGGAGFLPIAQTDVLNDGRYFSGSFDGLGHVIDRLTINRPTSRNIGLFSSIRNTTIANVGLTHASILGRFYVGGLAGQSGYLTISNSYSTGTVIGDSDVGGLVGRDIFPRASVVLRNVYSTADVTAMAAGTGNGQYSGAAGGLIGHGGLIIQNSYATGIVTGGNYVGGLAGTMAFGSVSNSYFAGTLLVNGIAYATGAIIGASSDGAAATLTNVYWNTDTVGAGIGSTGRNAVNETNVAGLSTAQMRNTANWVGFNFTTTPGGNGWVLIGDDGSLNGSNGKVLPMLASEWSSVVRNAHQLQLMTLDKSASYTLANDIDARATDGSSSAGAHDVWLGGSFVSVGVVNNPFIGRFDGQGHSIAGLTIEADNQKYTGMFGLTDGSVIRNVGLVDVNVNGYAYVGGLVGSADNTTIDNVYVTGSVTGEDEVVGGLVGHNDQSSISNAYSTASVSGTDSIGGLVGYTTGSISNTYATGNVIGTSNVGGVVGEIDGIGSVNNSYYATTDADNVAINNGGATDGVFAGNAIGSGKTYADLTKAETFANWDMDTVGGGDNAWRIYEGNTTPLLKAFLTRLDGTVNNDSATYNGQAQTGNAGYAVGAHDGSLLLGAGSVTGGGINAGNHALKLSGLYSTQQGYDIVVADGVFTIDKAALTVSTANVIKTYDGTTAASGTATVTGGALFGNDTISGGSFAFGTKNAGSNKTVNVSGVTVNDGNGGGNYDVTYAANTGSTINKAGITVSTSDVTKTYDGTTTAAGTATLTGGTLFGTDALSGGTFAFTDKNVGSNKTVTVAGVTVSDGTGGSNYDVSYVNNTSSTITEIEPGVSSPGLPASVIDRYAGAVTAIRSDNGNSAESAVAQLPVIATADVPALASFTVRECGMNLPAQLKGECQ